ncbi:hypothetical protein AB0L75_40725 [Streptomyces sp. NPDC052101]
MVAPWRPAPQPWTLRSRPDARVIPVVRHVVNPDDVLRVIDPYE